jgi:hypothetical protein
MQLLTAKFAQIDTTIEFKNAQITALQAEVTELQEHRQQLLSVDQACTSALAQFDTAIAMLTHVDSTEIATFKNALLAKFDSEVIGFLEPAAPPTEPEPEPTAPDAPLPAENQPIIDVQISSKSSPKTVKDKKLDSTFGERIKEKEQFLMIENELNSIGIKIGKLINSRSDAKGWNLTWGKDKAGLFWTTGNGWEVASLKPESELSGQWEGFDLIEHLANNGIDFDEESSAPLAA